MGNAPAPDVVIDPYRSFKVWIVPISIWMDATNRKQNEGCSFVTGTASWSCLDWVIGKLEGRTELPLRSR